MPSGGGHTIEQVLVVFRTLCQRLLGCTLIPEIIASKKVQKNRHQA